MVAWGKVNKPGAWEDKAGFACSNPPAFICSLHIILNAASLEEGLRLNVLIGGDNCGRAPIIAAILAAVYGLPASAMTKIADRAAVADVVAALQA